MNEKRMYFFFLNKKSYIIYYFGFMDFIDYKLIM